MKKFYLFCSAGMSTSLLANKMQKAADQHKLPIEVKAFPIGKMGQIIEEFNPDCILLGPQVKYLLEDTKKDMVILISLFLLLICRIMELWMGKKY